MNKMMITLLMTLAQLLMTPGLAAIALSSGSCPDVQPQKYFSLQRFLGRWYNYAIFESPYLFGLSCITTEYSLGELGTIQVLETGVRDIRILNRSLWRSEEKMRGVATMPDPYKPTALLYNTPMGDEPNYLIVETDYYNYALIYSCNEAAKLPFKIELAYILTRARGVRPANWGKILSALERYGVNTNYFVAVDQSNC